ncbi:hypothetical protein KI387_028219 [Taxus chinensis]|uniref:Uncharacterized protein n=1 Tax=Taxus chinensis TaxID=29808 RepID=A0AA38G1A2_TAXCH|nr:hypothetical protein KI387_028219 [Taxus chinensis]
MQWRQKFDLRIAKRFRHVEVLWNHIGCMYRHSLSGLNLFFVLKRLQFQQELNNLSFYILGHIPFTSFSSFCSRIASKTMSDQHKILEPVKAEYHVTSPKIEQCTASPIIEHVPSPQDDGHTMYSQEEEQMHSPKHQTRKSSPDQVHICNDTSNDLEEGEIKQLDSFSVTEITADVSSSPQKTEEFCLKNAPDTSFERLVENSDVACEDVDMEVDMEVDDQTVTEASILEEAGLSSVDGKVLQAVPFDSSLSSVTSIVTTGSGSFIPILIGDNVWGTPPQPPEEDWAPPPPPDGDSIPPPPPDEPPPSPLPSLVPLSAYEEPLCPVLPYTEQYASAYGPMANYNYYSSGSTESVNPNYYAPVDVQTDGTQLSYYDNSVYAYAEGSGMGNPVEGVIYYESDSGTIPKSLEPNNPEYYMYYENVGAGTYCGSSGENTNASQVSAGNIPAVTGASLDSSSAVDVASNQVSACVAGSSTVSAAVVPSTSGGTAGVKGLSKDLRSKKRSPALAPTLRSNKKVSSLVDKWKAAKEELHGSDDEDENEKALEVLEKKRQREIEEWRMQQLASGEAHDNANFQPLGGDWRERVKRRKTETTAGKGKSETAPVTAKAESNGAVEKKKPNLADLSRDLPAGWQAFWDKSSGEVYYGLDEENDFIVTHNESIKESEDFNAVRSWEGSCIDVQVSGEKLKIVMEVNVTNKGDEVYDVALVEKNLKALIVTLGGHP